MCRRYRQRPSEVCHIVDPEIAFDFDLAMATVHHFEEQTRAQAVAESNPMLGLLLLAMG